jgi:hypothetical protein
MERLYWPVLCPVAVVSVEATRQVPAVGFNIQLVVTFELLTSFPLPVYPALSAHVEVNPEESSGKYVVVLESVPSLE